MSERSLQQSNGARVALRIMATSDVHATLLDYDYAKDRATKLGSLARAATVIENARKDHRATLVVDNGDFLQGAAISDIDADPGLADDENPVIAAMNVMRYDAVGLGNHEFNVPATMLRSALQEANFPVLCANLALAQKEGAKVYAGLWAEKTMVALQTTDQHGTDHTLKVGFFSVLPPQVIEWDKLRIGGRLVAEDMLLAAHRQVRVLQAGGADVIVALAHSGISETDSEHGAENVSVRIAEIEGVAAVISGHVHRVFPGAGFGHTDTIDPEAGTLHGVPSVMPGVYATHLGQIDLTLEKSTDGWQTVGTKAQAHSLMSTAEAPPPDENAAVAAAVAEAHERALARMRRTIGAVVAPVTSYFSMVRNDCASRLVAEAKLSYVRRALSNTALASLPLIASVAPLKCGGRAGPYHYVDVPPGEVSARVIADMQPYSNHISVVQLKGRDVAEWLEKGCSVYNQLLPDLEGQFLYDRDAATYNREAIYGLSYAVDLSHPARYAVDGSLINPQSRRVVDIRYKGTHIAPDQDFLLVTNDYRGGGGGNFPNVGANRAVEFPPARVRDVLAQHIALTSGRRDHDLETWRLYPLQGVRALFDTGPGAARYKDVTEMPMTAKGSVDGGFARFELDMAALPRRA